jgi:hypothetical protein
VEFFLFFLFSRIVLWLQFGALFIFFIQLGHLVSFGKSMFDMVG